MLATTTPDLSQMTEIHSDRQTDKQTDKQTAVQMSQIIAMPHYKTLPE
jgi:hypothetical protein